MKDALDLFEAIKSANELIRSMKFIVERKGDSTNWSVFKVAIDKELIKQHKLIYPDSPIGSIDKKVKQFKKLYLNK